MKPRHFLVTLFAAAIVAGCIAIAAGPRPFFEEIAPGKSGISWVHENAMSPNRWLPETMGPGCAFLDYDNDGWMDIYLVNSGPSDLWTRPKPVRNALYRNNHDGSFTDVTEKAHVDGGSFGMGAAAGDYNGDGYPDLLITGYGRTILYRNNRDGTFTDVTASAGLPLSGWTTGAAWFDYDNDGKLDLFIGSYVAYGSGERQSCGNNQAGRNFYCVPKLFPPTTSFLFHNTGNGTFRAVEGTDEIGKTKGKALGVVAADINNDGRMDLFVANDTDPNYLFVNRGSDGQGGVRWEEIGLAAGVAFSADGRARSGMGVAAGDVDGDGWQDLFVSNIDQEKFSVYRNNHDETFTDTAFEHGVAQATRLLSGWGAAYFDFDNDGAMDLIVANGHPDDMVGSNAPGVEYRERMLLFANRKGRLHQVDAAEAGPVFSRPMAARGLAVGDFMNDGRLGVLVGVNGGAPVLLRNGSGQENHWIGIQLEGTRSNRDAIGATIRWQTRGVRRSIQKTGGGSYLSSHDPRVILGLGAASSADWVEVRWPGPNGKTERFTGLTSGRYHRITERR